MSTNTPDVMVDLETMGTGPNAAIVAIGAVAMDIQSGTLGEQFYRTVNLDSAVKRGGAMDADTVRWWLCQSDQARAAISGEGVPILQALWAFEDYLHAQADETIVRVWGNGAAFDNVILASAYRNAGHAVPWKHWNDRCYRTVKAMHPNVPWARIGTHHNALDDATSQARHLMAMLNQRPEEAA